MATAAQQAEQFLSALFSAVDGDYWFHIWTLHDKRALWTNSVRDAIVHTLKNSRRDIYAGGALSTERRAPNSRFKKDDAAGIVGLWADIDYGPSENKKRPPTAKDALALIAELPLKPTITIHSGHGYQCWWLLEEPWTFDSDAERESARLTSHRWNVAIRNVASNHGWTVDSVFDLSRVMRIPGTVNAKDIEHVPVELIEIDSERRYNPDDFLPFLPDVDLPEEDAPVIGVTLTLDPNARAPDEWIHLIHNDPEALKLFNHEKSIPDPSPSGYDMALANLVAQLDWTPQQVADLLIFHRRKHGYDLKLREDYYQRTILKALAWATQAAGEGAARDAADELTYLQGQRSSGDVKPEDMRDKLRENVSEALGVKITNVYRYSGDQPQFMIEIEGERIPVGSVANLIEQGKLKLIIAAHAGLYPRRWKEHEWRMIAQSLLDMAIHIDLGSDATGTGEMMSWLQSYTERESITTNIAEAMIIGDPFIWHGAICVHTGSFVRYLKLVHSVSLASREIAARLEAIGAERTDATYRVGGKVVGRSVWMLPKDTFPPPVHAGSGMIEL